MHAMIDIDVFRILSNNALFVQGFQAPSFSGAPSDKCYSYIVPISTPYIAQIKSMVAVGLVPIYIGQEICEDDFQLNFSDASRSTHSISAIHIPYDAPWREATVEEITEFLL